jgi:SAM-dependent methyltransferase
MDRNLDAIGCYYGTDKASVGHGFLSFYERFFHPIHLRVLTVLEFGVSEGKSLLTWRDYFLRSRIIGVDINPDAIQFRSERIEIEIGDQSNIADLLRIARQFGPFDIILDDASHKWDHQILSLQQMFPYLRPGGFYVVEDTHTSHGTIANDFRGLSGISTSDYLYKVSNYVMGGRFMDVKMEPDPFIRTYAASIGFVAFGNGGTCVLQRRD